MRRVTLTATPGAPLDGLLVYSDSEYSFRFDVGSPAELASRLGSLGRTSLEVGTLQLELDVATGTLLFVWGLHPRARWVNGACSPNRATPGIVHARSDPQFVAGVTIAIAEVGNWSTTHDGTTGWVRIAEDPTADDDAQIMIASGTVVGLDGDRLASLWLQPVFESQSSDQAS